MSQVELDQERGRGRGTGSRQYNVLFYGNPGTGKTTVARIYGEVLQELGVLKNSKIVEKSGAALVNGGVSELKKDLKGLKDGGVLFIDEAYQLNPKTNPMGAQVREACFVSQSLAQVCLIWVMLVSAGSP